MTRADALDRKEQRAQARVGALDDSDRSKRELVGDSVEMFSASVTAGVDHGWQKATGERAPSQVHNAGALIGAAVGLGIGVIVLLLMILISGEFADAIPSSGAFTNASNATETNGNTAYEIMAVALLVLPVGAVLGTLAGYMGGWISFNGGGFR